MIALHTGDSLHYGDSLSYGPLLHLVLVLYQSQVVVADKTLGYPQTSLTYLTNLSTGEANTCLLNTSSNPSACV